jgi:mannose-6-phosphate isomerase-like protein (cupin superfamily)
LSSEWVDDKLNSPGCLNPPLTSKVIAADILAAAIIAWVTQEISMDSTAERYAKEPVRYPALQVVDLAAEGAAVTEPYRNMVISRVNDSCLRLAVFDEAYRWHYHPKSDELFIVVSGCLAIDLADNRELHLQPWQCVTIPAMARHRTRALGRTVNLCFENLGAETVFVDPPW